MQRFSSLAVTVALSVSFACSAAVAHAATYIELGGGKPQRIPLVSLQWGAGRGISSPAGAAAEREGAPPNVTEVTIVKRVGRRRHADVFSNCKQGCAQLSRVTLVMEKRSGEKLRYKLDNAMVTGVQWSASSGGADRPTESVTLSFSKIEVENSLGKPGRGSQSAARAS